MPMTGEEKNRKMFERMPVPRAVMKMALPTVLGQIVVLVYNMADTFFIGRTANPLMVAGASLILPVYNISIALSSLTGIGGGASVSRLMGKHQDDEARRVFSFSVRFSSAAALLFSLLTLLLMDPLLNLLGTGPDTAGYAKGYALCVIVIGGLPTILSLTFSNLIRSAGESGKAGFGVTLGGLINMALDPLFMFVLLPEGQEIYGAGIATCLSNCISCVYFILVMRGITRKGGNVLKLCPMKELPSRENIRKIFSIGVPSSVVTLLFDVDYIVLDRLMSGYGNIPLAAIGIVLKAERLPLNIGVGICQGMVPLIAYNFAAGTYDRMKAIKRFSLLIGIGSGIVSIILYEIFAPDIMRFFISDAETVRYGTEFLRFRSVGTLMMFMCFFHVNVFNGYGKGDYALALGLLRWLGTNIPMLFIMNAVFGMFGLVWASILSDSLTAIVSFIVHRRFEKKTLLKTA